MFTISVQTSFRASHQLTGPSGSKEAAHSHNWTVTASVSSDMLNDTGLVMDFNRLKSAVNKITDKFNNMYLNETNYFRRNNPSAENVAKYIYEKLEPILQKGLILRSIRIMEEPGCTAEFTKSLCSD
jgi:6-pyruvoyltetrahydropterin/6-carboxytetrahydropterin synthase